MGAGGVGAEPADEDVGVEGEGEAVEEEEGEGEEGEEDRVGEEVLEHRGCIGAFSGREICMGEMRDYGTVGIKIHVLADTEKK